MCASYQPTTFMDALYFGITVHFRGTLSRLKNVNLANLTYIDLLDDVAEKSLLNSRTCQIELIVHVGEYGGTFELGGEEGVKNEVIDLGDTYDVVEGLISEALKLGETLFSIICGIPKQGANSLISPYKMQMVIYGVSLDANGLSFGIDTVGVDTLDIYLISALSDIRIAIKARMKLASTNTLNMLIVASMINSLVLTLPSGIVVPVSSVYHSLVAGMLVLYVQYC
ncbi:hypothetical protein RHSIM_Rhsim03G0106500 [Rhododendron simsii]|uniref:Uncharacterized protein n=1 Tax=Rhododendron simsii TaxID=118357 RepID=A0A834LUF1_RHOSS|nr:hypothetical protein RHSIM_Rhsim03G0106500 [Rhododendron simsii]